jgi:hypothetical protein
VITKNNFGRDMLWGVPISDGSYIGGPYKRVPLYSFQCIGFVGSYCFLIKFWFPFSQKSRSTARGSSRGRQPFVVML